MPFISPSYNGGSTSLTPSRSDTRPYGQDNNTAGVPACDFWADLQASNGEAFFPASMARPSNLLTSRPDATQRTPSISNSTNTNRTKLGSPSARATQPSPVLASTSTSRHSSYSRSDRASVDSDDDESYSPSQSQEEDDDEEKTGDARDSAEGQALVAVKVGRNAKAPSSNIIDVKASGAWTSREEDVLTSAVKKCGLRWSLVAKKFREARTGTVRSPKALSHRWYAIGRRAKVQHAAAKTRSSSYRGQRSSFMPATGPVTPRSLSPGTPLQQRHAWAPEETRVLLKSLRQRLKGEESPAWYESCKDYFSAFPDSTRSYPAVQQKCRDLCKKLNASGKDIGSSVSDEGASTSSPRTSRRVSSASATRHWQAQNEDARRSTIFIHEEHQLGDSAAASSEPFGHHDEAPSIELEEGPDVAAPTATSPQTRASSSIPRTQPQHAPQAQLQFQRHQSQPQPQAAPAAARPNVVDVDVIHQENGVRIESNSGGYEVKIFAPLHVKIITAQEATPATTTPSSSFGQATEPAFHFIVSDMGAIRAPRLPADTEMSVATTVVGQGAEAVVCIDRIWVGPCGYKAVFRSTA